MPDATNPRETEALLENCQCFQRPTFADPPCAICKAADAIEQLLAQRKRVLALCDEARLRWDGRRVVLVPSIDALAVRAALEEPCK